MFCTMAIETPVNYTEKGRRVVGVEEVSEDIISRGESRAVGQELE